MLATLAALLISAPAAPLESAKGPTPLPWSLPEPHLEELILVDGSVISGLVSAENITVEEGSVVFVRGDAQLRATQDIIIRGVIRVLDVELPGKDSDHAGFLDLEAQGRLLLFGQIYGGQGRSFPSEMADYYYGRSGGDGSSIRLCAPDLSIPLGFVRAGDGGVGGACSRGGKGGTLFLTGRPLLTDGIPEETLEAMPFHVGKLTGKGAKGGRGSEKFSNLTPGDSGWSGGLVGRVHPLEEEFLARYAENNPPVSEGGGGGFGIRVDPLSGEGTLLGPCQKGPDRPHFTLAVGQNAPDGENGTAGTSAVPDGGDGANGGSSEDMDGRDGRNGVDALSCCEPTEAGKKGGNAAHGESVQSGDAGKGGDGGAGWVEENNMGTGGKAGDGGSSGNCIAGSGGDGGDGSDGQPAGPPGSKGDAGTATAGTAGAAGTPGTPAGSAGTPGGVGTQQNGVAGVDGFHGGACPR